MLGKQGEKIVSIPLPQIEIPRFRYGQEESGGVGQGPGEAGDPIDQGQPGMGPEAGSESGDHPLEVDVQHGELALDPSADLAHEAGLADPARGREADVGPLVE